MSYPINSKINPYNQQQQMPMGMNSDSSGNSTPMGLNTADVQDNLINTSPTVKGVVQGERKWLTWALFAPVWASLIYPMNKFNNACKGKFEDSLIGRVSKWAEDKGNHNFFKSPVAQKVGGVWTFIKTKFMDKAVPKSRVLSAFFHTPSKLESNAASMMAGGTYTELAADAAQKLEMLHKQAPEHLKADILKKMGVTLEELEKITEKSHDHPEKIIEICERLGKTDLDHYVHSKVGHIPFTKNKYFSDVLPGVGHKVLDVDVYFSGYANKMKAIKGANKTWFGKLVPKAMLRTIEGITNGTAGGKIAIGMAAYFIADSIKDAINAPKGEKVSKFAESNIQGLGFYMLMPLMVGTLNHFGGLKYIGMNKDQLKEYRAKIDAFNKRAQDLAAIGTKDAKAKWKTERNALIKELKEMRKGTAANTEKLAITGSNWFTKFVKKAFYWPIKKFAGAITYGREVPQGFWKAKASAWEKLTSSLSNMSITLKKWSGYPIRFPLVLFAISPFFINPILRLSHMIFGKPSDSTLDDGKEKPEEATNHQPQPVVGLEQQDGVSPPPSVMMPNKQNTQMKPFERQNLLDMYKAQHSAQQMTPVSQNNMAMYNSASMTPAAQNYNIYAPSSASTPAMIPTDEETTRRRYIPSSAPVKLVSSEPARSYMPSPAGVVINPNIEFQESLKAQDAFMKAEKAELKAKGHVD